MPGEAACVRASGQVRFDAGFDQPTLRGPDPGRFQARGTTTLQARRQTEWGLLATTIRFTLERGDPAQGGYAPVLDYAVTELGGFAFGRTDSVFERASPMGGYSFIGGNVNGRGADGGPVDLIAYTRRWGEGVSLTVSLEEAGHRETGIGQGARAGLAAPDLVGSLRLERDFGMLQLSGAIRSLRGAAARPAMAGIAPGLASVGSLTGGAVQLAARIRVPWLGPGGTVSAQAAFASGANAYTGWSYAAAGTMTAWLYDAWLAPDGLKPTRSWSINGGAQAFWTPALRSALFGAYGGVDAWGRQGDLRALTLGANTLWSPVKAVDLGGEVVYSRLMPLHDSQTLPRPPRETRATWSGRIRLQRDF